MVASASAASPRNAPTVRGQSITLALSERVEPQLPRRPPPLTRLGVRVAVAQRRAQHTAALRSDSPHGAPLAITVRVVTAGGVGGVVVVVVVVGVLVLPDPAQARTEPLLDVRAERQQRLLRRRHRVTHSATPVIDGPHHDLLSIRTRGPQPKDPQPPTDGPRTVFEPSPNTTQPAPVAGRCPQPPAQSSSRQPNRGRDPQRRLENTNLTAATQMAARTQRRPRPHTHRGAHCCELSDDPHRLRTRRGTHDPPRARRQRRHRQHPRRPEGRRSFEQITRHR